MEDPMIGKKVKIGPFEAEIRSEEDCAKVDFFVAMTKEKHDRGVAEGIYEVPGTKAGYFCEHCNKECVLAPSGQRIEALGAKITCMDCLVAMAKESN